MTERSKLSLGQQPSLTAKQIDSFTTSERWFSPSAGGGDVDGEHQKGRGWLEDLSGTFPHRKKGR